MLAQLQKVLDSGGSPHMSYDTLASAVKVTEDEDDTLRHAVEDLERRGLLNLVGPRELRLTGRNVVTALAAVEDVTPRVAKADAAEWAATHVAAVEQMRLNSSDGPAKVALLEEAVAGAQAEASRAAGAASAAAKQEEEAAQQVEEKTGLLVSAQKRLAAARVAAVQRTQEEEGESQATVVMLKTVYDAVCRLWSADGMGEEWSTGGNTVSVSRVVKEVLKVDADFVSGCVAAVLPPGQSYARFGSWHTVQQHTIAWLVHVLARKGLLDKQELLVATNLPSSMPPELPRNLAPVLGPLLSGAHLADDDAVDPCLGQGACEMYARCTGVRCYRCTSRTSR